MQARAAAFVKTLKREGIERKGLQAAGGILIKINKLNCSAFQANSGKRIVSQPNEEQAVRQLISKQLMRL